VERREVALLDWVGAHTFGEKAGGFSTTSAGSFLRASRTDSVNRGSSISLFTLVSVVLALRRVFFFCILYADTDRSQNLFSIAHTALFDGSRRIYGRIRNLCPGSPRHTVDHLACNHSQKACLFHPTTIAPCAPNRACVLLIKVHAPFMRG
jgi:hypothetical protein